MDHFLSLIYGDYDNFPNESYKDSHKKDYNERYDALQVFFKNLNFKNIRLSKEFEINENPNDNFFYILTDIVDFEVNNNIHEWSKVLLRIMIIAFLFFYTIMMKLKIGYHQK